jgi:hypothetical protein
VPLARVCELTGVARSSVYARRSATVLTFPRRRGPKTASSDTALTEAIGAVPADRDITTARSFRRAPTRCGARI